MQQLDSENADLDLTSKVTVLTHTPDASNPCLCQGIIFLGDDDKGLDGSGGDFEVTVRIGDRILQPDPQTVSFSTAAQACLPTVSFTVPADTEVRLKVKSPNAGDTDVDVTASLYDVGPLQATTRGRTLNVDASGQAPGTLSAGERNAVADAVLARDVSNANPTEEEHSLRFVVLQITESNLLNHPGYLTVFDTAGTEIAQKPVTSAQGVDSITGIS